MEENKEAAQIFLCVIIIIINTQTERFLRAHHTHAAQVYKILIFPAVLKFFATLEFQILQISQKFRTHIESKELSSHNHSENISFKKIRGDNTMEVGKFSRVNGAWLKENVGNQVALVGKVVESDADTVKITASVRSFLFVFEKE
jgi:hypothetical protein